MAIVGTHPVMKCSSCERAFLGDADGGAMASSPTATSPSPSRNKPAAQKMLEKLENVINNGKVMPVAFLSPANAAPLALLDHTAHHRTPVATSAATHGGASGGNAATEQGAARAHGDGQSLRLAHDGGLNTVAHQLVSELAVEGQLASVPQQMREKHMAKVCICCLFARPTAVLIVHMTALMCPCGQCDMPCCRCVKYSTYMSHCTVGADCVCFLVCCRPANLTQLLSSS